MRFVGTSFRSVCMVFSIAQHHVYSCSECTICRARVAIANEHRRRNARGATAAGPERVFRDQRNLLAAVQYMSASGGKSDVARTIMQCLPLTRSRPQTRGTKCQELKNLGRIRGIPASTFLLNSPVRQSSTAHGSVRCHPCGDAEQSGRTLQRRGSLRRCRATLQAGAGVNTREEGEYPQFLDAFCLGLKEFGSARFCAAG